MSERINDERINGCLCDCCGKRYKVDLLVGDDLWQAICGVDNLLCGRCIVNRIEGRGLFKAYKLGCVDNHECYCGMANKTPHEIGKNGCARFMTESPVKSKTEGFWIVGGYEITDYTLRHQRGFAQHDCGCWSRWEGSENSLDA